MSERHIHAKYFLSITGDPYIFEDMLDMCRLYAINWQFSCRWKGVRFKAADPLITMSDVLKLVLFDVMDFDSHISKAGLL